MDRVIATAGHIDHGKSALVEALTGTHPDRLPEEKRRGMTLDLGFAHLDLIPGLRVGIVDVPGHEKFVHTMVAGAAGVDAVLLVVAATEGIMPQTREHFDICRLLGLDRGVVALTKTDVAEPTRIAATRRQIAELTAATSWAGSRVVGVSALTGAGLEELRTALAAAAAAAAPRAAAAPARLPLDRVFSLKGFGTVVTGTLVQGTIRAGDVLALDGGSRILRVRGLHAYGTPVTEGHAGQRLAVNLAGIEVSDLERGAMLVEPGVFAPTQRLDGELEWLPGAPSLSPRTRLRLHHFTAERLATLVDLGPAAARGRRMIQLRLDSGLLAAPGDRFLLRRLSPAATLAGGRILDTAPPRHRAAARAAAAEWLAQLPSSNDAAGLARVHLARTPALKPSELATAIGVRLRDLPVAPSAPAKPATQAPRPVDDPMCALLAARALTAGLACLTLDELLQGQPATARAALAALAREGTLVEIRPGFYLHAEAVSRLRAELVFRRATHPRFTVGDFKTWTSLTRKHAMPLLEFCDLKRWTRRNGDARDILVAP